MHQHDHLERIATVTGNDADWIAYKHARNQLNSAIKLSKASYYHDFLSKQRKDARNL